MTYPRVSHLSDNRQIASAINQALKLGESAGTGGGTGTVTTTGTPASGNLAKFSGSTSITNADLTGDVTTSGALATTIASGAVTLAKMANMATASLIYRKTAGSGAPEVNSLATLKTDLGLTGTNSGDQTITLTGDVTGSGTGSFATTMAVPIRPGGRLTLVTATPVLTSDQTAKTSVFYTPHQTDRIPVYTGSAWVAKAFAELTLTLDTTNHASGSLYDVFVWNNSGTISIGTGPAWTSSTARGTGAGTTELQLLNGVWTNKSSITLKNGAGTGTTGIAANTATYVGTFYATAAGQTGMAFKPTAATGGTNNFLALYNAYNRIRTIAVCRDSTASWTYNATTWRSANNSASNRISFVDGLQQSSMCARREISGQATAGSAFCIGLNLDSTTNAPEICTQSNTTTPIPHATMNEFLPQLGLHWVQAMEVCATAATATFSANETSPTRSKNWLSLELEM